MLLRVCRILGTSASTIIAKVEKVPTGDRP
jgi:hypothetical protein